ncbi:threonylcarbamoyl-AMP synthase [Microcoleus sp. FACHB-831]|uniref:L-threonylcarbamoyladenylate synthase n=1 Tax=Microcoleus sp. FACHB-831 TaxID=2692827 RepID=UPI0016896135|nr:L-threonylcarbamoyladenylate synthase [Microcoleus sp. FACHB-831]MBD1923952.1 threonylcarbamoyl-AMP synthase [Microcoleus sp. FACHB-831]
MATIYTLHPETPQTRLVEQIVQALRNGAVMLYPSDTVYAIGCDMNSKSALERVRRIKQLSNDKPLTFLCSSLSNIAQYALVNDSAYRIMKSLIPGPYTFLLPATKLVPRLVQNPKRKTTGIRVPDHQICQSLLQALGNPIISTSAHLQEDEGGTPTAPLERAKLFDQLDKLVDVIVDDGVEPGFEVSTILDLTNEEPALVRQGLGWEAAIAWASPVS